MMADVPTVGELITVWIRGGTKDEFGKPLTRSFSCKILHLYRMRCWLIDWGKYLWSVGMYQRVYDIQG